MIKYRRLIFLAAVFIWATFFLSACFSQPKDLLSLGVNAYPNRDWGKLELPGEKDNFACFRG